MKVRVPLGLSFPLILWLIGFAILAIFQASFATESESIELVVILLHGVGTVSILLSFEGRKIGAILSAALFLRVSVLLWDLKLDAPIVHSGVDSEGFFLAAVRVSEDLSLLTQPIYGSVFTKANGILFHYIGPMRAFAQYTNVLLTVMALLVIYKLLVNDLKVNHKIAQTTLIIGAFLPNPLIISALFLRESIIFFLVALSVASFVKWILGAGFGRLLVAILLALIATSFHSGALVILVGYILVASLYSRGRQRFGVGRHTFVYMSFLLPAIIMLLLLSPDLFLGKFQMYESSEELFSGISGSRGGSGYLGEQTVDNFRELALLGPLRAFYFVGAPMPWDIRGLADLLSFTLDSVFYLATLWLTIYRLRELKGRRKIVLSLTFVLLVTVFLFGAGVSNAGTAIRHRFKLLPFFLVLFALVKAAPSRKLPSSQDSA